ncbi:MAG TPA: NAD-dependent epimerase/dehydratase family protein [Solirubrobacteraceae bacterium]|jgi:nucleoside-diphosphate-sugar epimerase
MIALVTGAAGFIGSHLCEHLLAAGDQVRAVDAFTEYYARDVKEENLAGLSAQDGFTFVEGDLEEMPLAPLVEGVDVVYHLAGQPGVRSSWGSDFAVYVRRNVVATQRLLEACRRAPPAKLVYASSSSVYGDALTHPTPESACPHPVSPYGVTKLAGEHLCELYRSAFCVPTASLRLFTVYGPRQRPDMAFSRLVECALRGDVFELFGDGGQTRDTTFVGDVVEAMRAAAASPWVGVANVGGGVRVSMSEVVARVSSLCGPVDVARSSGGAGDVRHTSADTRLAAAAFGYRPRTTLDEGLRVMVEYERSRQAVPA